MFLKLAQEAFSEIGNRSPEEATCLAYAERTFSLDHHWFLPHTKALCVCIAMIYINVRACA